MKIRKNVPISSLTTMRLGGDARFVAELESANDVHEAYQFAQDKNLPTYILGGGANTIGHDMGFLGVILLNRIKGIEIISESESDLLIKAMGGEIWDDVVEFTTKRGFSGIEAMSKIPGTVGAAPVQNIGAYGQDIASVIASAEVYGTKTHNVTELKKADMKMGYRRTRFNTGDDAGRFLIMSVTLELKKTELKPPFYNSLQHYIDEHSEDGFDYS